MGRVIHFEIQVDDPGRAEAFYTAVFGWKVERAMEEPVEYWLFHTGEEGTPGIDGAMMRRMGPPPSGGDDPVVAYLCTISVHDVEASAEAVKANGGQQLMEPNEIPGIGRFCYCKDTEGNTFGILQQVSAEG